GEVGGDALDAVGAGGDRQLALGHADGVGGAAARLDEQQHLFTDGELGGAEDAHADVADDAAFAAYHDRLARFGRALVRAADAHGDVGVDGLTIVGPARHLRLDGAEEHAV